MAQSALRLRAAAEPTAMNNTMKMVTVMIVP
jgi:hypothetical protein